MQDMDLEGKVAIVTGSGSIASGIGNGRAAAVLLAEAGAHVLINDLTADKMTETIELVKATGADYLAIEGDVSRAADCERLAAAAIERWGRVDVLVNNVGIAGPAGTVVEVDLEAWERTFHINVTSMLLMSRYAIPHMIEAGGGSIVNITSAAGLRAIHPAITYSTTKGAIVNFTRSMALAHGADNIRVNAIAPGMAYTPIVYTQGLSEEGREQRKRMAPLGTEGTGWDVGEAVLFLAGAKSKWITGVTLPVDGGLTAATPISNNMTVTSPNRG